MLTLTEIAAAIEAALIALPGGAGGAWKKARFADPMFNRETVVDEHRSFTVGCTGMRWANTWDGSQVARPGGAMVISSWRIRWGWRIKAGIPLDYKEALTSVSAVLSGISSLAAGSMSPTRHIVILPIEVGEPLSSLDGTFVLMTLRAECRHLFSTAEPA